MKKNLFYLLILPILASCAHPLVPHITADHQEYGLIELSYQYHAHKWYKVDWRRSQEVARERCIEWGYKNASPIYMNPPKCNNDYQGIGKGVCIRTVQYQCLHYKM